MLNILWLSLTCGWKKKTLEKGSCSLVQADGGSQLPTLACSLTRHTTNSGQGTCEQKSHLKLKLYIQIITLNSGPYQNDLEKLVGHSCSLWPNGKRSFRVLLHSYIFPILYLTRRVLIQSTNLTEDSQIYRLTNKCMWCGPAPSPWLFTTISPTAL